MLQNIDLSKDGLTAAGISSTGFELNIGCAVLLGVKLSRFSKWALVAGVGKKCALDVVLQVNQAVASPEENSQLLFQARSKSRALVRTDLKQVAWTSSRRG